MVTRGVSTSNITHVVYSKGEQIALPADSFIPQPDFNFVSPAR